MERPEHPFPAPYAPRLQAPRLRTADAADAHEHAEQLSGWTQRYEQITSGRYRGKLLEYRDEGLQVFREDTSHALQQVCRTWPDGVWLGVPISSGPSASRINGHPLTSGEWMVRSGGEQFELQTPVKHGLYGVVIHKHQLEEAAFAHGLSVDWRAVERMERLTVDEPHHEACRTVVEALLNPQTNTASVTACLQEIVIQVLSPAKPMPGDARSSWVRSKRVVQRARELVEEPHDDRISVPALCNRLHVSRRTLQYCFEKVLGMSPMQYLRITRLNAAQRLLRAHAGAEVRIQDVAFQCGFWHLGQFSADYKRLFGESPSASLRRWRLI